MNKNVMETVVGAVVLLVACYFLYYAYSTTQTIQAGSGYYTIFGKFSRIDGVNLGSDVRVAGIKVGKVTAQKLDPKTFEAIVQMNIRPDIALPVDTSAEIIGNGLLGEKYVALVPGGDDEVLKDNAFIQFTQSSVSLEGLIGKFMFGGDQSNKQGSNDKAKR